MGNQICIDNQDIKPGESRVIALPMPRLYDCAPMTMPVHVINGESKGPILCLTATVHGDEVNGIEIIRRILKKRFLKKLQGTLIAIPVVNMYGFLYQDRYLMDRRDLNRSFPGSEEGSLAARLAYIITSEIIDKCTHLIDLHTGSLHRSNLPQIRANIDNVKIRKLARAFNPPIILKAKLRDGSLREYAYKHDIPSLLYEAGEALRFDEFAIKAGVRGIFNVMHALGMLEMPQDGAAGPPGALMAQSSYWVRASHSGIIKPMKRLGASVTKGELLAKIGNPTGIQDHPVYSPLNGIIIGRNILPMVHEGGAIFNIATLKDIDVAAEHIENIQEFFDETLQL